MTCIMICLYNFYVRYVFSSNFGHWSFLRLKFLHCVRLLPTILHLLTLTQSIRSPDPVDC